MAIAMKGVLATTGEVAGAMKSRLTLAAAVAALAALTLAGPAAGHPHIVSNPSHDQVLANGQSHPGFQPINGDGLRLSCEGSSWTLSGRRSMPMPRPATCARRSTSLARPWALSTSVFTVS